MFRKLVLKNYYSVEAILSCVIRFYQQFISPYLGHHCRFYPSCSEYSCLAIKKYGVVKGCWKALMRILRCHPFNRGGIDYP